MRKYKLLSSEDLQNIPKVPMTKNIALKMALEAIEVYSPDYMHGLPKKSYVKAIKLALLIN
jgi:hypothetical protein